MATKFEPHGCVIFIQSTIIGTLENKGIHSNFTLSIFLLHEIWEKYKQP